MGNSSCFKGKLRKKTWWRVLSLLLIVALNANLLMGSRFAKMVSADAREFVVQPHEVFDSSTKKFTISWQTSFEPDSYAIELYDEEKQDYFLLEENNVPVASTEQSHKLDIRYYGKRIRVQAYYTAEVFFDTYEKRGVASSAILSLGSEYSSSYFCFTEQPQDASFYTEPGHSEDPYDVSTKFKINCKTPFVPTKILIVHDYFPYFSGETWTTDKTYKNLTSGDFECTDFLPDADKVYVLVAYFCDSNYIVSKGFRANNSGFAFTTEPQSGSLTYDEKTDKVGYVINFGFTQRPLSIEVYNEFENRVVGYPYLWETVFPINTPGYYELRAKFSDSCTLTKRFEVGLGDMAFVEQPTASYYTSVTNASTGFGKLNYSISWKTNFDPVRVELGYYTGKEWNVKKTYTDVDNTKKTVTDFIPPWGSTYYFRAYYSDWEYGYIESEAFREDYEKIGFTKCPQSGMNSKYETYEVDWELSFHPCKMELYRYEEVPDREWGEFVFVQKINNVNDSLILDRESGGFQIRAYYTDEYYAAMNFGVCPYIEFIDQPKDGRLEKHENGYTEEPYYEVNWKNNIDAQYYVIYKLDANGEKQHTPLAEYGDGVYYVTGPGEYIVEAQYYIVTGYGSSDIVYKQSEPFTVLPYERFNSDILKSVMLPSADEGEISWDLNFEPLRMGARKYLDNGSFEIIEFSDPSSKGTYKLPEGVYDLFAFYGDDEESVIYSNQFTVEKFKFTMQPYFYWKDALGSMYHNTQDIPYGKEDTMSWQLNATSVKMEMVWDDEDGQTHSMSLNPSTVSYLFNNCGDESTWGHHRYRIRAWLTEDEDSMVESDVCFVTLQGPAVNFDNIKPYDYNGGSMGYWISGSPFVRPMKPVYAGKGGKVELPQCALQPPKGKMLDYWVINGVPYNEGDVITISHDVTATPVWTDLRCSLNYQIDDYTLPHGCRIYLDTIIDPYIPSLWADFYYLDGESTITVGTPPVRMEYRWIDLSTGQVWEHPGDELAQLRVADSDVIGGVRWFVYGPTEPGEYCLEFIYVDHDSTSIAVRSQSFRVTEGNVSGEHTYELNQSLDKVYDGEPVFFDTFKGISVDGGKSDWGMMEKMGDVRYEFREVVMKGKEEYTFPLDSAPVEVGMYQLVIQERDPEDKDGKLWIDAAIFPFEITEGESPVTYEYVEALDPTYEAEGHLEFYAGSDGNYYILEDGEYVEVEWEDLVLPKKEYTMVEIDSKDINGYITSQNVRVEDYGEGSFTVPASPYLDGYNFAGWKVNGTLYTTSEEVQTAVAELVAQAPTEPILVEVDYEQKDETYYVAVIGGTFEDGTSEGYFQTATELAAEANQAQEGQQFDHWELNGEVAGYNPICYFHVSSHDMTLEAVYSDIDTVVEKKGTAFIESVTVVSERKLAFVSKVAIPEGARILRAGIVANTAAELDGAELTTDTARFVRYNDTTCYDYLAFKYTWTKKEISDEDVWCVRSYLVYRDETGEEHTVYGELVQADVSGIINE